MIGLFKSTKKDKGMLGCRSVQHEIKHSPVQTKVKQHSSTTFAKFTTSAAIKCHHTLVHKSVVESQCKLALIFIHNRHHPKNLQPNRRNANHSEMAQRSLRLLHREARQ